MSINIAKNFMKEVLYYMDFPKPSSWIEMQSLLLSFGKPCLRLAHIVGFQHSLIHKLMNKSRGKTRFSRICLGSM